MDASAGPEREALRTRQKKVKVRSAGIIPIHWDSELGQRVLLLRCYDHWDFPKGSATADETPLVVAQRKLREETLIDHVDFLWGQSFKETLVYSTGKMDRYYVGRTYKQDVTLPINPEIGRPEHHEYRWVTWDQARALVHSRLHDVIDWARSLTGG